MSAYPSLKPEARCRIYFIRPVGMHGPVKIGSSVMPHRRRAGLEAWSPFPLEIVADLEGPRRLEQQFHALFRAQHSHGEWFHWSPEMEEMMAAIRAGIFPVELLPPPQSPRHSHKRRPWTDEQKAAVRARNQAQREARAARQAA